MLQSMHQEAMRGSEFVEEYGEQEVPAECEVQKPGQNEFEERMQCTGRQRQLGCLSS